MAQTVMLRFNIIKRNRQTARSCCQVDRSSGFHRLGAEREVTKLQLMGVILL